MLAAVGEADWQTITEVCGDMDAIKTVYETQQGIFLDNGTITENVPVEDYVLFDVMQEALRRLQRREVNDCRQTRRGSVFGGAPALFVLCVALAERTRYNKELNPRRGEAPC